MSGLNIKICDIVSDGLYTMSYKTGSNPCPTNNGFTTIGTGLTATTITLTGLSFNTQYWVKMIDETSNRYIIRNMSTNHSKTFPCYDTMCFNVEADCDISECQCKTFQIDFYEDCNEILYFTSCDGSPMAVQADYFAQYSSTTFNGGTFLYVCSCSTPVIDCTGTTITQVSSSCISNPTPTPSVTPTVTPTKSPTYKSWTIQECSSGPCDAGQCGCAGQTSTTVYTLPSVTDLTDPLTVICINTTLTLAFTGFFSQSGEIYEVLSGTPQQYCTVGLDPC